MPPFSLTSNVMVLCVLVSPLEFSVVLAPIHVPLSFVASCEKAVPPCCAHPVFMNVIIAMDAMDAMDVMYASMNAILRYVFIVLSSLSVDAIGRQPRHLEDRSGPLNSIEIRVTALCHVMDLNARNMW